jgi:activating signal cointegrator complex subunit 1
VTYFDEMLEDVGGVEFDDGDGDGYEDRDGIGRKREVKVVVWPGVIKYGDENGENGELRNVVCRGKVLCVED